LAALAGGTVLRKATPCSRPPKSQPASEQPQAGSKANRSERYRYSQKLQGRRRSHRHRSVGKGIQSLSLEREIGLGKAWRKSGALFQAIDDPVVTEYVNRVGQNLVRNSDARVPSPSRLLTPTSECLCAARRLFLRQQRLDSRAQEESDAAGVMAHEISHVTAPPRHQERPPRVS